MAAVVWLAAPDVGAGQVGLSWPRQWPGLLTLTSCLAVVALVVLFTRALRSGALAGPPAPPRPGEGRHAEPPGQAMVALLPRTRLERRLFALVGVTAGVCEEWLYRGFFLAVVVAVAPACPPRCWCWWPRPDSAWRTPTRGRPVC